MDCEKSACAVEEVADTQVWPPGTGRETLRVLLVEDDPDDYALTRDLLGDSGRRFNLDWVSTYDAGLEAIRRQEHDVYLLDYRLGGRDGLELLREASAAGARKPMILLTGQGGREIDLEAMRAGAADYVVKSQLDAALLDRAIRYAIAHKRNEEELERRVRQRTAELAEANEQLKASLHEKEVLLREIHHRVKNNLQVISSLLNLQSKYVKDEKALEMFKECQGRVRSMALIHQRLCQSKNLAQINFARHVQDLAASLFRSYGIGPQAVHLTVEVDDVVLGIDTIIPCTLIIHELVTNALKYAFAGGRTGEIGIELRAEADNRFRLVVRDNGVGLPRDFDYRTADSLGLQIVVALTEQLDGSLEVINSTGTAFVLTFRDLKYKERG
jgi:two-component sensor histidine kinase/CheY-like chemotaxis protein